METTKSATDQRLEFVTNNVNRYMQRQIAAGEYPLLRIVEHSIDDALTDEMQAELGGRYAVATRLITGNLTNGRLVTPAIVERVMGAHPRLHVCGYGNHSAGRDRFTREQLNSYRDELLSESSLTHIDVACAWIERYMLPTATINNRSNSYGIKHAAEKFVGYMVNGHFITAALLCGFRTSKQPGYNPSFNMSERSIKAAWEAGRNQRFSSTELNRQQFYANEVTA